MTVCNTCKAVSVPDSEPMIYQNSLKKVKKMEKKKSGVSLLFVYSANLHVIKLCIDAPMKIYDFQ